MKIHRNIKLLAWLNFFIDFWLLGPIAIIYFSQVAGSFTLGMSIFSIALVSAAIFEIPTGIFSDFFGRRKTVIAGSLASIGCVLFYALGINYYFLIIGALFEGLARAFYSGNNQALLYDSLAQDHMEKDFDTYLGKTSSMSQLAAGIAALGSGIIAVFSIHLLVWLTLIPHIVACVLAFLLSEPKRVQQTDTTMYSHLKEAIQSFIHKPKLRLLSASSVLSFAFGETSYQFQSAFVASLWPLWAVGIARVLSSIGAAISFYISGAVIRRFKELKLLIFDEFYSKTVDILALLFPTIISPLAMTSTSLLYGITEVASSNLLQKEFTDKQRATMGSLNSLMGSIAFGIIALLLGKLADLFGPAKALLITHILSFSVIFLYWKLFKHEQIIPSTISLSKTALN